MKRTQKTTQKNYKIIKIKVDTYNFLGDLIKKQEDKSPYLKDVLSFDSIIKMLLLKNKIKLNKYKYLKKEKKEVTA